MGRPTYAFALSIALIPLGCKSLPASHILDVGPSLVPVGWTVAKDPESGVSMGVAPGWQEGTGAIFDMQQSGGGTGMPDPPQNGDPNSAAAARMLNGLNEVTNHMAQDMEDRERERQRKSGIVVNIIDGSKPTIGEARTRYYVKKTTHDSTFPLELAVQEERHHFLQPGPGTDVALPVGKAHRFEEELTLRDGDRQKQISYVLSDGNDSYAIRFISTNSPDVFSSVEADVAKSFRLKHK